MGYSFPSHRERFSSRISIASGFRSDARVFEIRSGSPKRVAKAGPTPQNGSHTLIGLPKISLSSLEKESKTLCLELS